MAMDEDIDQDRYAAQLQEVFNSCDPSGDGYLNQIGLTQLCQRLQLEEQSQFLIDQLLLNKPNAKVNFIDFKDGFIKLLAQSVDNPETLDNCSRVRSPEREILPKYTWGSKKYGRRSRPESCDLTDCDKDLSDISDAEVFNKEASQVHNNETTSPETVKMELDQEVSCQTISLARDDGKMQWPKKKRRRSSQEEKLPSSVTAKLRTLHHEGQDVENNAEYLRNIWRELAVGVNGYLDLSELEKVCEHTGMEQMSQEVVGHLFAKLDTDQDGRISFEEFLHLFQNGDPGWQLASGSHSPKVGVSAWNEHSPKFKIPKEKANDHCETSVGTSSVSGMFSSVDPQGTGYADPEALMELWDTLGINNGAQILKELGLTVSSKVHLQDLSCVLEECLVSTEDTLLHQVAILSLQNELKHIRNVLDQVQGERNKLKTDVTDANIRASLLAQEVDDQNAKLEKASQNKILCLEKKYRGQIQSLQDELFREREQLSAQVAYARQFTETNTQCLREEESRLKEKINLLQKENNRLENESLQFLAKLEENEKMLQNHQREAETIPKLRQRVEELEAGQELFREQEHQRLICDLQAIKLENQTLRDRNDELVLEVESLSQQLEARPTLKSTTHKRNGSWLDDYVHNPASKRRGFRSTTTDDIRLSHTQETEISSKSFDSVNCSGEGHLQDKLDAEVELETEELSAMQSDGQGDFHYGTFDGMIYQNTHRPEDITSELDKTAAPALEMKQVFLYLQKQMKEEVISQCSLDMELLQTLEKDKTMLVERMEYLQMQHEDELDKCKESLTQQYKADIDKYREKCVLLQNCLKSHMHRKSSCLELATSQTNSSATDVCFQIVSESAHCMSPRDAEVQCEESNFSTINELNRMYFDLGVKCEMLKGRLELAMDELEMALDREGVAQEHLVALEGKYNNLKRCISPQISLDGNHFLEVIENDDTKNCVAEGEKLKTHTVKSSKYCHQSTQVNLKIDEISITEDLHVTHECFSKVELKCLELQKQLKAVQLSNHELVTAVEKAESEQMLYKRRSEDIEQARCALEERLSTEKEMYQQQMEALELYWKNQFEHVRNQHQAKLSECQCQIAHLEERLNDLLESRHAAKSRLLSSQAQEYDVITNEALVTNHKLTEVVEVTNQIDGHQSSVVRARKDSASLNGDCATLQEECTRLTDKKQHLEEEVAVLELEWASLEGYLSSQRSQRIITEAEIHHGPDSYPSTISNVNDDVTKKEPNALPDNEVTGSSDDGCQNLVGGHTPKLESDLETMHTLNLKLRHLEERCRYLEDASRHQAAKADNVNKKMKSHHKRELDGLKGMLVQAQKMLQRRVTDYEAQLKKADTLVKVLYVENAQVMEALQVTEERQKKFELLNVRLQEKCQALTQLVSEIYKTAIS